MPRDARAHAGCHAARRGRPRIRCAWTALKRGSSRHKHHSPRVDARGQRSGESGQRAFKGRSSSKARSSGRQRSSARPSCAAKMRCGVARCLCDSCRRKKRARRVKQGASLTVRCDKVVPGEVTFQLCANEPLVPRCQFHARRFNAFTHHTCFKADLCMHTVHA